MPDKIAELKNIHNASEFLLEGAYREFVKLPSLTNVALLVLAIADYTTSFNNLKDSQEKA